MTKEKKPQHKMGKHCGYEEHEDGSIEIASIHSDVMDRAMLERDAIDAIVESTTRHCAALMRTSIAGAASFWELVKEDYGLDFDKYHYSYHHHTKRISRTPKPKPVPESTE